MTTLLIVVCIVACIGVVLAIVTHLGFGVVRDADHRRRIQRHHRERRKKGRGLAA